MDLDLNDAEKALIGRLDDLLARLAPLRGNGGAGSAGKLLRALMEEGFLSFGNTGPRGLIQAMVVTQEVSKANGDGPVGLHAFLAPALFAEIPTEPIAIKFAGRQVPVRFANLAKILVVVGPEEARAYLLGPDTAQPVVTNYGYPYGSFPTDPSGTPIGVCPSGVAKRRWQLALLGEITGAMAGALDHLVAYLSRRKQFGREIGAFQAVQHRLAELAVSLECVRYLSLHAAWVDTDEAAASAACYAASAAHTMCLEAHQLSGAQGFTIDSGLYAWTLRLQSLSVEAGGADGHASIAAAAIWNASDARSAVNG